MTRAASAFLVLALASPASAQMPRRTPAQQHQDIELELQTGDAERRRQEHCAAVGQRACEEEARQAQREWDSAVRAGEEAHCREIGYQACRAEHEAEVRQARWDFWFPIVAVLLLVTALFYVTRRRDLAVRRTRKPTIADDPRGDLASLDVVLPIEAARALRSEIDRIRAATASIIDALPAIVRVIADTSASWSAVCVRSWPAASGDDAWMRWRTLVEEIRARPTIAIPAPPVRVGDGYREGPTEVPTPETMPYALLSISVLSKREMPEGTGDLMTRAQALLAMFGALDAYAVESVELKWLPDDERETQTMRELQVRQPRLVALA